MKKNILQVITIILCAWAAAGVSSLLLPLLHIRLDIYSDALDGRITRYDLSVVHGYATFLMLNSTFVLAPLLAITFLVVKKIRRFEVGYAAISTVTGVFAVIALFLIDLVLFPAANPWLGCFVMAAVSMAFGLSVAALAGQNRPATKLH